MMHLSSLKVNSIGSSIVTMWQRSRALTYWSIAAIVVDLPDPVTPARITIPWSWLAISPMTGGQAESLEIGDRRVDAAGDQAEPAALAEQVDAKAGLIAVGVEDDVGEVDAAGLFQDVLLARSSRAETSAVPCRSVDSGGSCICRSTPRQPHGGGHADLQVEVGALEFHHHPKQLVGFGLVRHGFDGCFDAVAMGVHSCSSRT